MTDRWAAAATILLINPNTSTRTTDMMLALARPHLDPRLALDGATAAAGPPMIVDEEALLRSADEVVRVARGRAGFDAVVVAAFGDPGVGRLRAALAVPVIGIGEAALREAAAGGRRFGIATTTPGLARAIAGLVDALGLAGSFTGLRLTTADPVDLASDPDRQHAGLAEAAGDAFDRDGADVVVVGGGPLGETAARLRADFPGRIVEPVPAAMRLVGRILLAGEAGGRASP